MCLQDAVDGLLADMRRLAKPSGVQTPEARAVVLRALVKVLGKDKQVWSMTPGDFRRVMNWITTPADDQENAERRASGLGPRRGRRTPGSITQAEFGLNQFARHCHENQWLLPHIRVPKAIYTPIDAIGTAKDDDRIDATRYRIPVDQWRTFLERAEHEVHMRCRMIVAFGLFYGRRISEIVRVQWKDIDFEAGTIKFYLSKRNLKEAELVLALSRDMIYELRMWEEWCICVGYGEPQPDWYLVANRADSKFIMGVNSRALLRREPWRWRLVMDQPADRKAAAKDFRRLLDIIGGFPQGVGTHMLRRTIGTYLADKYEDLRIPQKLLAHKSITTTEGYTTDDEVHRRLNADLRGGALVHGDPDDDLAEGVDEVWADVIELRPGTAA